MNIQQASGADTSQHPPHAPADSLASPSRVLDQADPETATTQDAQEALALAHEVAEYLAHWQDKITQRRDLYVLRLWELGWSQTRIAERLGVSKHRIHDILATSRAQASGEARHAHERRAAEEFEAEALSQPGSLFSMEPALAR